MKSRHSFLAVGMLFGFFALFAAGCEKKSIRAPIYDTQADGAKLIADALAVAQREHKRVLVEFGANWCIWCHRLHALLTTDPEISAYFKKYFLLVLVDVDNRAGPRRNEALIARYGNPIEKGIPGVVLLDTDGKPLKTQDTGEFESGETYDHARIMAFLKEWTPKADAPR